MSAPIPTIWKYPLTITDEQTVEMPAGARLLSAQFQAGELVLWAMVEPYGPRVARTVRVIGTGNTFSLPPGCAYVATAQEPLRPLVWHVFVDDETPSPTLQSDGA